MENVFKDHQLKEWFEGCPVGTESFFHSPMASTAQPKCEAGYKFLPIIYGN